MKYCYLIIVSFFVWFNAYAQEPTVGVIINTEKAFNGYTLFNAGPTASGGFGGNGAAYLVNNCGEIINGWQSEYNAGLSCYLDYKGNLVRPIQNRQNNQLGGAGGGGGIEIQDWDGNVTWLFDYNENNQYFQHHDIEPLPNGNILLIAWEKFSAIEMAEYGRPGSLVTEHIVEVKPTGPTTGEIVWEWHLIDHTVQHFENSLDNYGVIADNPQLIDVNLGNPNDHIHLNSVDYVEEFDLILLSSRFMSEIYIIDHSITTEEAAGHTGGRFGKGGDILYRWGNPQNYNKGDENDRSLNDQHGVHWVPGSYNNGKPLISIFDNNNIRNSFLVAIEPPVTKDGSFIYDEEIGFKNTKQVLKEGVSFAPIGSSCQGLPNGNFLYSINSNGEIGEVDANGDLVWQYIIPTNSVGPVAQGQNGTSSSFNAQKYATDFVGFYNRDLTPNGLVELFSYQSDCVIYEQPIGLPEAGFTYINDDLSVQFTDTPLENIDSLKWDFGDGTNSNENNPLHTYTEEGDYYTCLKVFNSRGFDVFCDTVTAFIYVDIVEFDKLQVTIFPNPAKNVVFLDGLESETAYKIYNNNGQMVQQGNLINQLQVKGLVNGKYFLKLASKNNVYPFIIER